MTDTIVARRYLVSGVVQGVGYRAFARRKGTELGLRGWARNLDDGRVEVVAAGSAERLDRLGEALASGPLYSRVENVDVSPVVAGTIASNGFGIR